MEGRQPQMVKMEGATEPDDGQREGGIRAWGFSLKTTGGGPPQNITIILRPSKRGFETDEYKIINVTKDYILSEIKLQYLD